MIVSIGVDHRGFIIKDIIIDCLKEINAGIIDRGTFSPESVDYPDFAARVADDVQSGQSDYGILVCDSGIGMSIAANRYKTVRAAYVVSREMASAARRHNNANILVLGVKTVESSRICPIINKFLNEQFEGGRHQRRIDKLKDN